MTTVLRRPSAVTAGWSFLSWELLIFPRVTCWSISEDWPRWSVVGIIEWPITAVIGAGHLLAAQRNNRAIRDLGEAMEQA